jgi:hypothetical protein
MNFFQEFREKTRSEVLTNDKDAVCTKFKPISTEPLRGINTTSIAFKVFPAYDKLRGILSKSFYRKCSKNDENYIAEDFIEECFNVAEVDYSVLPTEFFPPATLTSTGSRKHGQIPEDLAELRKHLNNFFVGFEQSTDKAVCYIWDMKKPIQKIVIDFGLSEPVELEINFNPTLRISLDELPNKCKILRIDEHQINEELDPEYSDLYWTMNKIKSIA